MPISETILQVDQQLPPIIEMHTSDHDLEKPGTSDSEKASISIPVPEPESLDIEHVPVENDPRKWSSFRKVSYLTQVSILSIISAIDFPAWHATLALITSASLLVGLGENIQNRECILLYGLRH